MTLHTLLTIKTLRAQRAEQEQHRHQLRVQACRRAQTLSVTEHQQYQQWRQAEEARLFEQCKEQPFNRQKLERWQQLVALLREEEARLEQAIAERTHVLVQERELWRLSQRKLLAAQQQVEKFTELSRHALDAERHMNELKEEMELDEFRRPDVVS